MLRTILRSLTKNRKLLAAAVLASTFYLLLQGLLPTDTSKTLHSRKSPPESLLKFLENFESPAVSQKQEVKDGARRSLILWTSWRSGSTFFGALISGALPNTLYSNEPLHRWGAQVLEGSNATLPLAYLQDHLHCQINSTFMQEVEVMSRRGFYNHCNPKPPKLRGCRIFVPKPHTNTSKVNDLCKKVTINFAKVIRLPLKMAGHLLRDEDLHLKVIFLIRDPRAVMMSRGLQKSWCQHETCSDPKTMCRIFDENLIAAEILKINYPNRFMVIQYDRVLSDMKTTTRDLMAFIGVPGSKNSSAKHSDENRADRWRKKIRYNHLLRIQKGCKNTISKLGLRIFGSEKELRNMSLPTIVSDFDLMT